MNVFRHSGKLGDIIYSLPAVAQLGGGEMLLRPNEAHEFSEAAANSILSLLRAQPYISDARIWAGEEAFVDLDLFRRHLGPHNLAVSHIKACGLIRQSIHKPWLHVRHSNHRKVVYSRSLVRHGLKELWPICRRRLPDGVFVGTEEEWLAFRAQFGEVEWKQTSSLLELAEFISGASVFVGNQSGPYAIAEGLKIPSVLEVWPNMPNCIFQRPNAVHISHPSHLANLDRILQRWGAIYTPNFRQSVGGRK